MPSPEVAENSEHGSKSAKQYFSMTDWALRFFAVVGILTSLFGYGVVVGLSDVISVGATSIIGGPFDVLALVWTGILILVTSIDKLDFLSIIVRSLNDAWPTIFGLSVAVAIATVLLGTKRWMQVDKVWFRQKFVPQTNEPIQRTFLKVAINFVLSFTSSIFIVPFFTVIGTLGIFLMGVLLLMIPMVGMVVGQAYFYKYVLEPEHCASVVPKNERKKGNKSIENQIGAMCVLVTSMDSAKPYKNYGRMVLSSSNYLLIYHPETGVGERVPVSNMVIQNIDDVGIAKLTERTE
jgi:hypothetical protein